LRRVIIQDGHRFAQPVYGLRRLGLNLTREGAGVVEQYLIMAGGGASRSLSNGIINRVSTSAAGPGLWQLYAKSTAGLAQIANVLGSQNINLLLQNNCIQMVPF
jgi:hypothetical protein